jgi:hypothetical protein
MNLLHAEIGTGHLHVLRELGEPAAVGAAHGISALQEFGNKREELVEIWELLVGEKV